MRRAPVGLRLGRDLLRGLYLDGPPMIGIGLGLFMGHNLSSFVVDRFVGGLVVGVMAFFWFWNRGVVARYAVEQLPDIEVEKA